MKRKNILIGLALVMASSTLLANVVSCGSKVDKPFEEIKLSEFVDYATELKLDKNSGRKFLEVKSIKSLVDGDTSHFYVNDSDISQFPLSLEVDNGGIIKIRYLGIDTPESTGQVEEWGKTASNFNKEHLKNAESIIIESNDSKWNPDSTGGRLLAYVWYRNAGETEYRNLNLEILQAGLSYAKSLGDLCYKDDFQKAYNQANEHKLYVFSKAASSWQLEASKNALVDSNGWIVGSTGSNQSIISFNRDKIEKVNTLGVYNSDGDLLKSTKLIELVAKDAEFRLGLEIKGKTYYVLGDLQDGKGEVTEDIDLARVYHIEKDASKKGYYNIYYQLEENEPKTFFTINNSNNISYMQRDPNFYYGSFINTTIKQLRTMKDDEENGYLSKLVRFEGIVTRISGQTVYVQDYDSERDLNYGMQVYLGYNFSGGSLMEVGNRLSICGTFTKYEEAGTYQVSGLEYMRTKPNYEKNTKLISTGNEITRRTLTPADFTRTKVEESEKDEDGYGVSFIEALMNSEVEMNDVTVTKVYTTQSGTSQGAMTLTVKDASGKTCTVRTEKIYKEKNVLATEEDFLNKTISVKGIVDCYNESYQLRLFSYSDVTFK